MIAELGHFSLILSLLFALLLSTIPLIGTIKYIPSWILLAKPTARIMLIFVSISYICLTALFIQSDFSVAYVAHHSNSHLPLIYRISGVWGGHEGSLLLWILILSLWTGAVSIFNRSMPDIVIARVLSVLGLVSVGFLLFILYTSNPFERLFPVPLEGRDLNPLLQDIGLAIHPPMLYLGYVGFSVAFAFSIAAMLGGRLDAAWARWSRPWTNIAWMFLTIGIALGSWWAYYELGWGGWWFWDPVENASFMPWLAGTALIHSLAATEKRGVFKAWTALLAVLTFSLSLLGTFLVRSGVLTSVHAFATDPTRGLYILIFLAIVIGGSLILFAWRAPKIITRVQFNLISRESGLLLNNIFLVVACFSVLLGTLYPLLLDALNLGKISVGPPYFNFTFVILTVPLILMIGIGSHLRWKKDRLPRIQNEMVLLAILSIVIGFCIPLFMSHYSVNAALGSTLGVWTMTTTVYSVYKRTSPHKRWHSLTTTPRSFYGMTLAHFGIGMFIIGVTLTTAYSVEKDIRLNTHEQYSIGEYEFVFLGVSNVEGPNYQAQQGHVRVTRSGEVLANLHPEKRTYLVQKNPMTEAAIDPGFTRDLYIAMGEPIGEEGAWAIRIYLKPFIRWIWLGAFIMGLGGVLAAADRRYRTTRNVPKTVPSSVQSV